MSVYTVHEPPRRLADALPDPARFAFVRDGFSFWAFLVAPVWMLWHRMWLVLVSYLVVSTILEGLVRLLGASAVAVAGIGLLIAILIGLEAGTLRRFTLSRQGWKNIGVISGDDREDAERRFFDAWVRGAASQCAVPSPTGPLPPAAPAVPVPRMPQTPDIIGLFPQPGVQR